MKIVSHDILTRVETPIQGEVRIYLDANTPLVIRPRGERVEIYLASRSNKTTLRIMPWACNVISITADVPME